MGRHNHQKEGGLMKSLMNVILALFVICFAVPSLAQDMSAGEMSILAMIGQFAEKYEMVMYILSGLGTLVVLGQAYVAITPTQDDDAKLQKFEQIPVLGMLLRIVKSFAPIQRKEKK